MDYPKLAIDPKNLNPIFEFIFKSAMGNPIIFNATPTNATMKSNTWGIYSNFLYIKFADGNSWKVQLTSVS